MMWHTHAALGASTAWLLLPLLPPDNSVNIGVLMAFCVVGALAPDLDAAESKAKHLKIAGIKPLVPVAVAINRDFGHRGFLHSACGWVGWTTLILPLISVLGWAPIAALSLGYASHLAGDACTRSGILLLFPSRKRFHALPVGLRVTTGSQSEEALFAACALCSMALLLSRLLV